MGVGTKVNKQHITQLVDDSGKASKTTVTPDNFLATSNIYAPLRRNNKVKFFTTGEDYFSQVGEAIDNAKKCVYIMGWQINYDIEIKGLDFSKIIPLQSKLETTQYELDQLTSRVDNYLEMTAADERKTMDQIFTALELRRIDGLRSKINDLNEQIAEARKDKTLWCSLREAVKRGVEVYVMPWSCPLIGPVTTYDLETMCAVYQLNIGLKEKKAFFMFSVAKSDMSGTESDNYTVGDAIKGFANDMFFSHHQKSVIIDNEIGFLGGIDLAYGRRDTADFPLKSHDRWGNDRYNPCIPPIDAALRSKHVSRLALILSTLADISAPAAAVNGFFTLKDIFTRISNWWDTPIAWDIAYSFRNFKHVINKKFESIKETLLETFFDPVLGWVMRLGIDLTLTMISLLKSKMPNYLSDISTQLQGIAQDNSIINHSATLESILAKVNSEQELTVDDYISIIPAIRNWYAKTPEGQLFSSLMDQDISFMKPKDAEDTNNILAGLVAQLFAALDQHIKRPDAEVYRFLEKKPQPLLPLTGFMLNKTQPRMPWHDVQMQTEGPAVYDLSRNFINRWNAGQMFMEIEARDNKMQRIEKIRVTLNKNAKTHAENTLKRLQKTILRDQPIHKNITNAPSPLPTPISTIDYTSYSRTELVIAGLFEFVHLVIEQGENIRNVLKKLPLIGSTLQRIEKGMIDFSTSFITAMPKPHYITQSPPVPANIPKAGDDLVQIIRSAPSNLLKYETRGQIYSKTPLPPYFTPNETPINTSNILDKEGKISPPLVKALLEQLTHLLTSPQTDCHKAWLKAISSSQDYLYIENQFFQSDFGQAFGYRKTISQEEVEQLKQQGGITSDQIARSGPMNSRIYFDEEVLPLIQEINADRALADLNIELLDLQALKNVIFRLAGYSDGIDAKPRLLIKLKDQLSTVWMSQFIGKLTQQFFSDTPEEKQQNQILQAITERIKKAIDKNEQYHVYIVLPVHPEGMLNADTTMHLVHLAMQTIYNGENSLIKSIQKAVTAKRLTDAGIPADQAQTMLYNSKAKNDSIIAALSASASQPQPDFIEEDDNSSTLEADPEFVTADWQRYLTLLNLRNWDELGGGIFGFHAKVVTEQIYIHSKLLIADDRVAIIGSCNINDRSMLGTRDSELAAIVRGGERVEAALNGKQSRVVSKVVQDFRIKLWRKIFGLDIKDKNSKIRPADTLADYLKTPAAPEAIEAIRAVAQENTDSYNKAFDYIPQDKSPVQQTNPQTESWLYPKENRPEHKPNFYPLGCSIWPLWRYNDPDDHLKGGKIIGQMPFEEVFWQQPLKKYSSPDDIFGFITLLPIKWSMGEGNLSFTSNTSLAFSPKPNNPTDEVILTANGSTNNPLENKA